MTPIFYTKIGAAAKINLTLNVTGRRPDGYHELESVMQSLSLRDDVAVTVSERARDGADAANPRISVAIICGGGSVCRGGSRTAPTIPTDRRNTAYKAAEAFFAAAGPAPRALDVHVDITKRIPAAAGLGGGSADAAAVLRALASAAPVLPTRRLTEAELFAVAARVGADVPFCLLGGAAFATGIGEILRPIPPLPPRYAIVLAKPPFDVSTAWVFANFVKPPDSEVRGLSKRMRRMVESQVEIGGGYGTWDDCFNVLESVTVAGWPEVGRVKALLLGAGADCAVMSGSGPTVFGLFRDRQKAAAAERTARGAGCWATGCVAGD